VGELLTR